ncbi:MAG: right-handed parallel beta-helix repeat-containing protein, partial [Bacteroidota bacterium]
MKIFDIKDFGAKGDGQTNDHEAFMKAATAINQQGGGHLIISPGTYIVGQQKRVNEGNIYYKGIEALYIHDCDGLVIEGFQAKIVYQAGLKFGYYESSGNVYTPQDLQNRVLPLSGDIGAFIALGNCTNVEIKNLDVDGNNGQLSLGGEVGTGRQCIHYGIFTMTVRRLKITNVRCHHFGTDGISLRNLKPGAKGGDAAAPYWLGDQNILENVICDYNGRNGMTLTASSNVTFNSCSFNHNATDPNISSKPKAGVDIEAESHSDGSGYNYRVRF